MTLTSATQQTTAPAGELDINTDGNSRITFSGVAPNTQYELTFCPFPSGSAPCQAVAALDSDASGSVSATFQFLQKGTYFGAWDVNDQTGAAVLVQSWDYGRVGDRLQSNVYRVADLTSGNPNSGNEGQTGTDPLTSGTVTVTGSGSQSNFPLHVVLNGAAPNVTYDVGACTIGGSSGCYDIGPVTTDATGNVDTTLNIWAQGFDVISFSRTNNTVGYNEFVAAVQVQ